MKFKTGEQYRCVKAPNGNFTEGKLYDLECNYAGQTWLRGNDGLKYTSEQCTVGHRLNTTGLQFEKVEGENKMKKEKMKFKLGQTYICTKSSLSWFTEGKEYPVIVNDYGKLAIKDDDRMLWFDYELTGLYTCFKLKEEPTTYTKSEITHQIVKAYQNFDNDSQRLAYLQGYFAK